MNFKKLVSISTILFGTMVWANSASSADNIKLYTIDCGSYDVADMASLSNTGEYDGKKLKMANPCFLIRHPKGDLLWETGHIDSLADKVNGEVSGVWHAKLKTKLLVQLAQLNIKPNDIEYLSLSHVHPDHAGNANKFETATFIVNELEHQYMFSEPAKSYFGEYYSALEKAKTISFSGEYDVFSDGSVIIKSMPGHTPGSSVLLVRLNKSGNILLSGDLYVHEQGRQLKTMHQYNVQALTLDSRIKFEALAKKENVRVVIQHDKQDFEGLPVFPKYLD
jgi:glyoxylase-like metal-dependent hydrolase (beta-lactamase superfamily II)